LGEQRVAGDEEIAVLDLPLEPTREHDAHHAVEHRRSIGRQERKHSRLDRPLMRWKGNWHWYSKTRTQTRPINQGDFATFALWTQGKIYTT
jgi:hypothetical protein